MSELDKARDIIQRGYEHLKWARDNRAKPWQKEREESIRVSDFYEEVREFLKNTTPKPTE